MQRRYAELIERVRWDRATVARFLGCWLSEPKPTVFFDPPDAPQQPAAFSRAARAKGLRLDARTQLLYDDTHVYINGAATRWPDADRDALARLANARSLAPRDIAPLMRSTMKLLHDWYRHGYVHPASR
jgi:50S ribosomal protein L16 3-hydroxylase